MLETICYLKTRVGETRAYNKGIEKLWCAFFLALLSVLLSIRVVDTSKRLLTNMPRPLQDLRHTHFDNAALSSFCYGTIQTWVDNEMNKL